MKSLLFSLLFLLIPKMGFSQVSENNELILSPTDKFYYLDSTSVQTNSKNYAYIRVIKDSKLKKESYVVQEYYRSGPLRMQGTSNFFDGYSKEGHAAYYYKNGTKKSEGEFIEDKKNHISLYKINQFWDVNGVQKVIDGNGFLEDTGENESSKGEIKKGFKEGVWEGSLVSSNIKYTEIYSNGKLISGISTDKNGVQNNYELLEIKPEPKGGIANFYQYIGKNYKPPQVQGLKGKIYTTFIIDKDGSIKDIKVLRDIGYGSGAEAIRVLSKAENWIPAKTRGIPSRTLYSLPITVQTSENNRQNNFQNNYPNNSGQRSSGTMQNTNSTW